MVIKYFRPKGRGIKPREIIKPSLIVCHSREAYSRPDRGAGMTAFLFEIPFSEPLQFLQQLPIRSVHRLCKCY